MIWFLRLFRAYRVMEDADRRAVALQARNSELESQVTHLQRQLDDARRDEILAVKTIANYSTQQWLGATPFPEARTLPVPEAIDPSELGPSAPRYVIADEIVARKTAETMQRMRDYYDNLKRQQGVAA